MFSDYNNLINNSDDDMVNNCSSKLSEFCFDWLEMFAQATVFVVVMLTFAFRIVSVSGVSMMNTLFNGDRLIIKKWYYKPQGGDIVVINKGQNLDMPIIKRIIATEGQTLKIDYETGAVTVNGIVLDELYIKEAMVKRGDIEVPVVIPADYAFVMGDNRNESWDSRFIVVGLIKNEDIVGKAIVRLYPFNKVGYIS